MGDHYQQKNVETASFLSDPEAKDIFAGLDYALKNGRHIQYWQKQEDLFRFIEKNYASLKQYYLDFFSMSLEASGESINKYYYLDLLPDSRGGFSAEKRHSLPNEYVIVGFMLYKIVYVDGYLELNSLAALQKKIRQDYEDIKPDIYRALAKAKKVNATEMDDQKVDDVIEKALKEFSKVGWIEWDGEVFNILPSFQRLPKIYGDYINNPDNWLKTKQHHETVPQNI